VTIPTLSISELLPFEKAFSGLPVLVTGHTGFTGGWLCLWLKQLGAQVTGLSLAPTTQPNMFDALDVESFTDSHIGDINDYAVVKRVFEAAKPAIVFHLAAQPIVSRAYDDPLESFLTNVMGTANVLEASRQTDSVKAVVCVTTDKVYDDQNKAEGYSEDDRIGGKDPYSASKSAAEMVARAYQCTLAARANKVAIATARGGNIIGGGDWADDRIVPDFVRAHVTGTPLTLRNPSAIRPWQHVMALCHGYLVLADKLMLDGEKFSIGYNFGPADSDTKTVGELVTAMSEQWPGIALDFKEGTFAETHLLRVASAKARAELGWTPPIDFVDTMALTANWYRDYYASQSSAREITTAQIQTYRQGLR